MDKEIAKDIEKIEKRNQILAVAYSLGMSAAAAVVTVLLMSMLLSGI